MVTPPHPADIQGLAGARAVVLARIATACARSGRAPASVTLVAVSKTVEPERLRAALAAGYDRFGENRVQEGEVKRPDVGGGVWELVGPLQANKARRALEAFDRIQTVDSVALAQRLDRIAAEVRPGSAYPVLLQVNVDLDPAKAGFTPEAAEAAVDDVLALTHLRVDGFMTVGRLTSDREEARATFRELAGFAARVRAGRPELGPELSMGMTDDYDVAVEEGATIVRVGRALFGERPHPHAHPPAPGVDGTDW